MEVWNVGEMIVMLVGAGGGGVFAVWRIVRNESETRRREFETLREESREAHEKIGGQITDVRKEITDVRKELRGESPRSAKAKPVSAREIGPSG